MVSPEHARLGCSEWKAYISHVASPQKSPWSLARKASMAARLSPRRKHALWHG